MHFSIFNSINESGSLDFRSKKSLKIAEGQLESVNRRRKTDNTIANQKVQKDKQRSTQHTYTTKERVT